ncbi:MAG: chorismate mutase [Oscillospiraceae bacterium]|jgi:3-deoxy-7-phosphoheptulonate synthase/chorismate mutase|nr:chorismate mutase [Oscillospiraceae bacterium]
MNNLNKLRTKINELDSQIIELLCKRFELAKIIGEMKFVNGVTGIRDIKREQEILETITCQYAANIHEVYQKLFEISVRIQEEEVAVIKGR